jgi:hypothetical protein
MEQWTDGDGEDIDDPDAGKDTRCTFCVSLIETAETLMVTEHAMRLLIPLLAVCGSSKTCRPS